MKFVQIDTGRIGGIGPAAAVARHAERNGVTFVNHTFTSHLALSASLQPYASLAEHRIAEYPVEPSALRPRHHHQPPRAGRRTARSRHRMRRASVSRSRFDRLGPYLHSVEVLVDGTALYAGQTASGTVGAGARAK